MTDATVTPERLLPHLTAWLERGPSRAIFAVHHVGDWAGREQLSVAGRNVDVRVCPSELAIREELARPRDEGRGLVLLTPVETLGADVLARLARPRVYRLLTHEALFSLFGVRSIDPELARRRWLVDALVDSAPPEGYEASGAVQLDIGRAWRALLFHRYAFDLATGLDGLLAWASSPGAERLAQAPEDERAAVVEYVSQLVPGADGVLGAVIAGAGRDAAPLGLVARVLADGPAGPARVAARTRFEVRYGWPFGTEAASAWAHAAEARLARLEESERRSLQQRADVIVAELQAEALVGASDVLLAGLRTRSESLAEALNAHLAGTAAPSEVQQVVESIARHRAAKYGAGEIATMALRITRWLARDDARHLDVRAAAAGYAASDAYADWARSVLRHGAREPHLDAALRRLVEVADARRDRQEQAFGEHLARWAHHAALDDALLGIEHVLGRVVAPLASERPVLLVILDGMSHRVAAELLGDLVRDGWIELRRNLHPGRALVVSALPSVTKFSRASLLSGELTKGLAKDEALAFAEHPDLAAAGSSSQRPLLFHKGGLTDPRGGLEAVLRDEISGDRRVVGVVVNAIDDHLARSDQMRSRWSASDILPLGWLLDAARGADRLVVLASDHGHVIERRSKLRPSPGGSGERWRQLGDIEVGAGEVLVTGTRVLTGGSCVLAASDRVRYALKKNGYHGGASAQEVLAPLVVLSGRLADDDVAGWSEVAHDQPQWWVDEPTRERPPVPPPRKRLHRPQAGEQLTLAAQLGAGVADSDWIDSLLRSDAFAAQRAAAGRTRVPDERTAAILAALDAHGGTMLLDGLARVCGIPVLRLIGTLAALRQMLNVDGYAILDVDDVSRDVRLDRELLAHQFELDVP